MVISRFYYEKYKTKFKERYVYQYYVVDLLASGRNSYTHIFVDLNTKIQDGLGMRSPFSVQ